MIPLFEDPPKWTQSARRGGGALAIFGLIVVLSYHWINYGYIAVVFIDAFDWLGIWMGFSVEASWWGLLGLVTLIALPVVLFDYGARKALGRKRRR